MGNVQAHIIEDITLSIKRIDGFKLEQVIAGWLYVDDALVPSPVFALNVYFTGCKHFGLTMLEQPSKKAILASHSCRLIFMPPGE